MAKKGFEPLFWGTGTENMGGWQNRIVFYPAHLMKAVPLLPAPSDALSNEELVTAPGAFEFKDPTDKPMPIYATDQTVKYDAENQGETDGQSFKNTGEFFYPGIGADAAGFARRVNNVPGYLLLISPEGGQYMVGQPGLPCTIKPSFSGGQARADRRGYKYTFQSDCYAPLIKLESPIDVEALFNQ